MTGRCESTTGASQSTTTRVMDDDWALRDDDWEQRDGDWGDPVDDCVRPRGRRRFRSSFGIGSTGRLSDGVPTSTV